MFDLRLRVYKAPVRRSSTSSSEGIFRPWKINHTHLLLFTIRQNQFLTSFGAPLSGATENKGPHDYTKSRNALV